MKRWWSAMILAAGLATFSGCATFSFKAGASPDTMSADERACRASAGDAGFVQCMRDRGWYVSEGTTEPSPAPAAEATAARPPAEEPTATPVAAPPATVPAPVPTAAIAPRPIAPAAAVVANEALPTATTTPLPAVPVPVAAGTPGALPRVRVGSWWKLGGTAAGLDASIATCVAKLGPPHQPDANARVVTVALRDCLRTEGWYSHDESPAP